MTTNINARKRRNKFHDLDRNCLTCGEHLKGRTDKKFCDDYCRSTYNNTIKAPVRPLERKISDALRRNRKILREKLGEQEETKVLQLDLLNAGFNFNYLTRYAGNANGLPEFFCFEFKYHFINDACVISREERFFDKS